MADDGTVLRLDIGVGGEDDALLDDETIDLREELLNLDVVDVRRPGGGDAPAGTRGGEAVLLGALLIPLSTETIRSVVRATEAWVSRRRDRSVRLTLDGDTLELYNVDAAQRAVLVETLLQRHGGSATA